MKVFLANPPWQKGKRFGVRAGSRWPFTMGIDEGTKIPGYLPFPFYLAYATALLEKNCIDVLLVDAIAEGLSDDEFCHKIKIFQPHLLLLETSTPSIDYDLSISQRIKEDSNLQLALSGPHVSIMGKEILAENNFVDYILVGEYEYTLLDLVRHLESGSNLDSVLGLMYRCGDGTIKVNPRRPLISNLDDLPWPSHHFLPMLNYNDAFGGLPKPNLQMWTSRGCPYQCIFCMWPQVMYGSRLYRIRGYTDVVDEMESCIKEYGFKSVYFDDDTFNIDKQRTLDLCAEIKRRKLNIPWGVMARADTVDEEMLGAMASAGLCAIKYGVESGVQEILDRAEKKLDLHKVEEIVNITRSSGVKVHLTFTFGLPGETKETIRQTVDYALSLNPDSVQFSITTPFPGTKYFTLLKNKGYLVSKDWSDYDGANKAIMRTEELTPTDLEEALYYANEKWMKRLFSIEYLWRHRGQYLIKSLSHPMKAIKFILKNGHKFFP